MKKEIPNFILELGVDIEASPNRSTCDPFWQVRHKVKIVTDPDHDQAGFWIRPNDSDCVFDSESDNWEKIHDYFKDHDPDWYSESYEFLTYGEPMDVDLCDLDDVASIVYYQEIEETVWTGLSEADAKAFIARKQHDYPKLYTYVESAYWSPRMAQLMNWLKEVSKEEQGK